MKIRIEQDLSAGTISYIDLPFDWSEVSDWFIKWDTLFYKTRNCTDWNQIELDSQTEDLVDWKHPVNVDVYELDEDGYEVNDEPLTSM